MSGLQKQTTVTNKNNGGVAALLSPTKRGDVLDEVRRAREASAPAPVQPVEQAEVASPAKKAPAKKGRPGPAVVYIDSALSGRIAAIRKKKELTNLQLILEAVAANEERLKEIIDAARIVTRPVADLFEPDPNAVRYKGGGKESLTYRPTKKQAEKLDEIGAELGFDQRSTWLAPVLEFHTRPRKRLPRAATQPAERTDDDQGGEE